MFNVLYIMHRTSGEFGPLKFPAIYALLTSLLTLPPLAVTVQAYIMVAVRSVLIVVVTRYLTKSLCFYAYSVSERSTLLSSSPLFFRW